MAKAPQPAERRSTDISEIFMHPAINAAVAQVRRDEHLATATAERAARSARTERIVVAIRARRRRIRARIMGGVMRLRPSLLR
jgi:hypothetical protein